MTEKEQNLLWPVPKLYFKVILGDKTEFFFQEVSGLDVETNVAICEVGNKPLFSTVKMPKYNNINTVALKKGVCKAGDEIADWLTGMTRQSVIIQLLDEEDKNLFSWSLKNAFPMKVTRPDFNAKTIEMLIEEIVLSHEGLTMAI